MTEIDLQEFFGNVLPKEITWKDFFFLISGSLCLEAIDQSSGSSFHAFFVKTTKES